MIKITSTTTLKNTLVRKKKELSTLQSDKAKETKKAADLEKKINSSRTSITRTKSETTIRSKLKEIERYNSQLSKITQKVSSIEKKLASKSSEIFTEENKLRRQEELGQKKREELEIKRLKEMQNLQKSLANHDILYQKMQSEIADLKHVPEKITVLFIASNPLDQQQLRLDEEAREIEIMIRKSEFRESVAFISKWATRPLDILQAINEINPTIVHFSGHGSDQDELVLQDNSGNTKFVSKEAIVQTMASTSDEIKLVFFNTCFSYGQAKAITEHVDAAIGMNTSIGDEAARIFSSQFYSAIGFGHSVQKAFNQAKSALMLVDIPEENTPELYCKDNLDPQNLILVQP